MVALQVVLQGLVGALKDCEFFRIFHRLDEIWGLFNLHLVQNDVDEATLFCFIQNLVKVTATELVFEFIDESLLLLGLHDTLG